MTAKEKFGKKSAKKKLRKKTSRQKNTPRTLSAQSRKVFRQCLTCGGVVDQKYGKGDNSWCPLCFDWGTIGEEIGQLPDPQMYGSWLGEQEEAEEKRQKENAEKDRLDKLFGKTESVSKPPGVQKLKTRKMHTGVYSCPDCCVEFDLFMDEALKCDDCGGPLVPGSLDKYFVDDDEAEY
jgi:hypothetical protein